MWLIYAIGSAFFAGVTSILAKMGIKDTDSNLATAIRTIVVLIFSWVMVFVAGVQSEISKIDVNSLVFLVLSGVSTGASWLCYFKALQIGDINKVTPIDKSSTIITMILALIILGEGISFVKCVAMAFIGIGTFLMIQRKQVESKASVGNMWLVYAFGSAIFASLTAILGKMGIENIDATVGTAIRTIVVLLMAWIVVFVTKKQGEITCISKKSWMFLLLSGMATGGSWLCYFTALQEGPVSVIVPIDKLSVVVTVAFSYLIFKEKLSKRALVGLIAIVIGTFMMLL